jgi:hypothetical protein
MMHDRLAEFYLKTPVAQLEREGWCRITEDRNDLDESGNGVFDYYFWPANELKLTNEQIQWLRSRKIEVKGGNLPDLKQKAYRATKSFKHQVSGD